MLRFDLAGRVSLGVVGDEELLSYAAAQLDPYPPSAAPVTDRPELLVRPAGAGELGAPLDLQGPAGDGTVTASDGETVQLQLAGHRCALPDPLADQPALFAYEPGFPISAAYKPVVRTALQLSMLRSEAVTVHSAGVVVDGGAVLIAGWSETGKTEVALALVEKGARFLSDKWTVLGGDRTAAAFPIDVGIRRWVVPYLPRLRRSLPATARMQFGLGVLAGPAARPLDRVALRGRRVGKVAEGVGRALSLVDRVAISPSGIRLIYGDEDHGARVVPLRAVVLLTTAAGGAPSLAPADPAWGAKRLARSAGYERRPYFSLAERARFALPDRPREDLAPAVVLREEKALGAILPETALVEVRTPFPADPRPVADLIAEWL